jgi:hypothetical protein
VPSSAVIDLNQERRLKTEAISPLKKNILLGGTLVSRGEHGWEKDTWKPTAVTEYELYVRG